MLTFLFWLLGCAAAAIVLLVWLYIVARVITKGIIRSMHEIKSPSKENGKD